MRSYCHIPMNQNDKKTVNCNIYRTGVIIKTIQCKHIQNETLQINRNNKPPICVHLISNRGRIYSGARRVERVDARCVHDCRHKTSLTSLSDSIAEGLNTSKAPDLCVFRTQL